MRLQTPTRLYQSLLATLVLVFSMTLQAASDGDWQRIGEKQIIPTDDTTTIRIAAEAKTIPYKTLKFHVTRGNLKIRSAKVHMSDGHVIKLSVQKLILAGLETREFPIPDHYRSIKKIVLNIQAPIDHSSNVIVYGKKADTSGKEG
ncbi:hypothetical protein [Endozoicomonas numazuensis]|uniref:Uncharacterized protein n=1 Tax=Endozoicomonas numazuensis TaxID=1137799 RepID=A0A081ND69_9GAMM|nr:hypothetical protein [Endozoicomonas numazuensis]KEQ16392.1 hypothetical protein GZ78_21195 [Endozoicomonas numazuensis]